MRFAALVVAVLVLSGCRVHDTVPWPPTASMTWGGALLPDEQIPPVRHFEYQMVSVDDAFMASAAERGLSVGLYIPADTVYDWMAHAPEGSWAASWWFASRDHLAQNTSGGPWSPWPGQQMIDVTDRATRRAMVASVAGFFPYPHGCKVSLTLDYLSVPREAYLVGDQPPLDLDRDGIGHYADPDEQALLLGSYKRLLVEYRDALPQATIVANGSLALRDGAVRGLLDGVYLEGAGAYWPWWHGLRGVDAMLHPDNPGNWLSVAADFRPGGQSVIEADGAEADDARAGSMYAVALAMMLTTDAHPVVGVVQDYGHRPPVWGDLEAWGVVGRPTSEYVMTQPGLYARAFEDGIADLRIINSGQYPHPFVFRLRTMDGAVVAEIGD